MDDEFSETILGATKRLEFVSDGLMFSHGLEMAERELLGLKQFFLTELGSIRSSLEGYVEIDELITKSYKHLGEAEAFLESLQLHDAWHHTNAAHGFLARVSLGLAGMQKELDAVESSSWWSGLTWGSMLSFVLFAGRS